MTWVPPSELGTSLPRTGNDGEIESLVLGWILGVE